MSGKSLQAQQLEDNAEGLETCTNYNDNLEGDSEKLQISDVSLPPDARWTTRKYGADGAGAIVQTNRRN